MNEIQAIILTNILILDLNCVLYLLVHFLGVPRGVRFNKDGKFTSTWSLGSREVCRQRSEL